ncbi:MAG: MFS transporter [Bacteroidota bacterium]
MKSNVYSTFPKTFWIANLVELFERWAWYGLFAILALFLTGSTDEGALGFSQTEKGTIMGTVSFILYFLPVITGAIADRYGYKKILLLSFGILASGYLLLSKFTGYNAVFMVLLFAAIGGAFFKPVISATISRTTNDGNSSIGFGIFYMMVNIGAFVGPFFASKLRQYDWEFVFYMSAFITAVNFILVLFFYKEPVSDMPKNNKKIGAVIVETFSNIGKVLLDIKYILFLLIITGFWAMYFQLFYSLPVFISQWVDTSVIYNVLHAISPALSSTFGTAEGTIAPEMLTNIDAMYIIMFQIIVSSLVMRIKPLTAMSTGFLVSAIGIALMFAFRNPFILVGSILIFGLGEMSCSPKTTEYIGKIAPKDKVALYIGTSFIPLAGGNIFAGILSGKIFETIADKKTLILNDAVLSKFNYPEISSTFTINKFYELAASNLKMSPAQLTEYLWNQHHPWHIAFVYGGIGLFAFLMMILYDRFLAKR